MDSTLTPAQKWAPYALSAGNRLGIDPSFVLAQWLYETGNGTNLGATKYNNLAGIKSAPNSGKGIYDPSDSIHAGYTSLKAFTDDYVRVMQLDYYKNVMSTAKAGTSPLVSLSALNLSPWAEADYNTSGFLNYYNQAASVMGSKSDFTAVDTVKDAVSSFGSSLGIGSIDGDGITDFFKTNWWLIAIGLVLIAVIRK